MMKALQPIRVKTSLLFVCIALSLSFAVSLSFGGGTASAHASLDCGANNVLCSNQTIPVGNYIISSNGTYRLTMQSDGNLVLYNNVHQALWASCTANTNATFAILQSDGNFVVYNNAHTPLWASNTAGRPNDYLLMQDNGDAVIYDAGSALWASHRFCR